MLVDRVELDIRKRENNTFWHPESGKKQTRKILCLRRWLRKEMSNDDTKRYNGAQLEQRTMSSLLLPKDPVREVRKLSSVMVGVTVRQPFFWSLLSEHSWMMFSCVCRNHSGLCVAWHGVRVQVSLGSRTYHRKHSECLCMNGRNGIWLPLLKWVRVEGTQSRFVGTTVGLIYDLFTCRVPFLWSCWCLQQARPFLRISQTLSSSLCKGTFVPNPSNKKKTTRVRCKTLSLKRSDSSSTCHQMGIDYSQVVLNRLREDSAKGTDGYQVTCTPQQCEGHARAYRVKPNQDFKQLGRVWIGWECCTFSVENSVLISWAESPQERTHVDQGRMGCHRVLRLAINVLALLHLLQRTRNVTKFSTSVFVAPVSREVNSLNRFLNKQKMLHEEHTLCHKLTLERQRRASRQRDKTNAKFCHWKRHY